MGFLPKTVVLSLFGSILLICSPALASPGQTKKVAKDFRKMSKDVRKDQRKEGLPKKLRAKTLKPSDATTLATLTIDMQTAAASSGSISNPCDVADVNEDGIHDLSDIGDFIESFLATYNVRGSSLADVDLDGDVDNQDYARFYYATRIVHDYPGMFNCSAQ